MPDHLDVAEVFETSSYKDANQYLKLGWKLLSTYLRDYGHPVERHQWTVYCLAWPKDAGDPQHPESPQSRAQLQAELERLASEEDS